MACAGMLSFWPHLSRQLLKGSGQVVGSRPIPTLPLERPTPPRHFGATDQQTEAANGRGPVPRKLLYSHPSTGPVFALEVKVPTGVVTAL